MATFGDMIDEIKFNLDRTVASEDEYIRRNIIRAIEKFQEDRFVWNDRRLTLTCVASQDVYTSFVLEGTATAVPVEDVFQLDWVLCTPFGTSATRQYDLRRKRSKYLEILSEGDASGRPVYWDVSSSALRLYPTPEAAHTLLMRGLIDVNDLTYSSSTGDGGSNPWMNEAEEMVMAKAMSLCYRYWLKDMTRAREFESQANQEFLRHRSNYERLMDDGKGIVPYYGSLHLDRGVNFEF